MAGSKGSSEGRGLRQMKHLPQSRFTSQFFIMAFGIAFYHSNLSTLRTNYKLYENFTRIYV
jgi:hypothetical protein